MELEPLPKILTHVPLISTMLVIGLTMSGTEILTEYAPNVPFFDIDDVGYGQSSVEDSRCP